MRDLSQRKLPSKGTLPSKARKKYQPTVGRDLGIDEIEASDKYETSRTRDHLAKVIVRGGAVALVVAVAASFQQHSFAPVAAVWAVLGPIAGGIVSFYFYRGPKG